MSGFPKTILDGASFFIPFIFVVVAISWCFYCFFDQSAEPIKDFQRSGSLLIAFILFAQIEPLSVSDRIVAGESPKWVYFTSIFSAVWVVFGVIGTAIWGYGDLMKAAYFGTNI